MSKSITAAKKRLEEAKGKAEKAREEYVELAKMREEDPERFNSEYKKRYDAHQAGRNEVARARTALKNAENKEKLAAERSEKLKSKAAKATKAK